MKAAAYWVTGSVALYSDALETVINVVAALGALGAISFGEKPADANHPYGHQKVEYLSAVIEGALVLVTAFAIGREAWLGWEHPRALETPFLGIALNGAGGVINFVWALVLIRSGRQWKSPALVAGGRHIMTDVWTTGVASLVRSSPLISAAFSFDRNDSKGTIAAIATSGSFFSSRLS
jgi:cation diffusion facilitator family transporter